MEMSSVNNLNSQIDSDVQETGEWVEALQGVIQAAGPARARHRERTSNARAARRRPARGRSA